MASEQNNNQHGASPLSLLVFAANAQSRSQAEANQDLGTSLSGSQRSAAKPPGPDHVQSNMADMEFREALQREALQREALQRQAALMGFARAQGLAGGIANQEQEYLQQLRLEALVQQRRQETLAHLALAQEAGISPEIQAYVNPLQLQQQAALMRQELLLSGAGGAGVQQALEQQLGALGGRMGGQEESALIQYLQDKERQQKMAAAASSAGTVVQNVVPTESPDNIGSSVGKSTGEVATPASAIDDDSKTTVLPCRARGMPMDHNVKTAYFVIPEDIKHGTELVCSYYACRNAGIKFRYCTYCKLPVAKRNFCKRHKHTGKIPSAEMPKDLAGEDDQNAEKVVEKTVKAPRTKPAVVEKKEESKVKTTPPKKQTKKPKKAKVTMERVDGTTLLGDLMKQGTKNLVLNEEVKEDLSEESKAKKAKLRQKKWDELLSKRPRKRKALLAWANQVLEASDLEPLINDDSDKPALKKQKVEENQIEQSKKEKEATNKKVGGKDQSENDDKVEEDAMEVDEKEDDKTNKLKEDTEDMRDDQDDISESKSDEDESSDELEKQDDVSDAASTSSESMGSVDLRASKN